MAPKRRSLHEAIAGEDLVVGRRTLHEDGHVEHDQTKSAKVPSLVIPYDRRHKRATFHMDVRLLDLLDTFVNQEVTEHGTAIWSKAGVMNEALRDFLERRGMSPEK